MPYFSRNIVLPVVLLLSVMLSACGGDNNPPATELVIVTPQPTQLDNLERDALQATIAALEVTNTVLLQTLTALPPATDQPDGQNMTPSDIPPSSTATMTPLPTETLRPGIFPTPRTEIASVVEQVFEGGRMIWFRETRQVAVLVGEGVDPEQGEWLCFEDTYMESEPEFLPTFQPPPDITTQSQREDVRVQQPIRGFGKIWRENPEIREQLGWALTSEIEHSPVREYIAGGVVQGEDYVPGPGEYRLGTFFENATILLYELELNAECPTGTWRLRRPQ